jgi:hypothetical protein
MANITILDSGYLSAGILRSSQVQLSYADRAGFMGGIGTVNAFTLKVNSMSLSSSVNVENKPIINRVSECNTSLISVENRSIRCRCIIKNVSITASWNVSLLYQFIRLERTHGLKLLYATGNTNINVTLIDDLGLVNVGGMFASGAGSNAQGTVSSTTPYLVGRIKDISVDDQADTNYWKIDFTFELTEQ